MDPWPQDVGIVAMECIFPSQYVDQSELEQYDKVSKGKYTLGLGQSKMGFCTDREDINSLCLTVVSKLMERNKIDYARVGRLEVGTESILDKSKSVKSVLMQLLGEHGCTDVEGVDSLNACYGGTAALFNSVAWVESSAWDGRLALVVAADIAVYAKGSARPTGGAGAVAMLVGPHAPLVMDRGVRSSYMKHAYDFYKPNLESEYPVVDGQLSIQCYLSAVDNCYQLFCKKTEGLVHNVIGKQLVDLNYLDALVFHAPYCKLVQKSVARLLLNDFVRTPAIEHSAKYPMLKNYSNVKLQDTYSDRNLEKTLIEESKGIYEEKTKPSLLLANQVGNMYTASVYGGLVSLLVNKKIDELAGKRIAMFSYGSGFASSMFSLRISPKKDSGSTLSRLLASLSHVKELLEIRQKVPPEEFAKVMDIREQNHHKAPYTPVASPSILFPGTWYLDSIDELHRRQYKRLS